MLLLLLKLSLVPALLLATSFAARRFGPRVGGRLVGLPLVIGPILVVLTLEHGEAFGARAAAGALGGVAAVLSFNLAFAHLCRTSGAATACGGAIAAWAAVVLALGLVAPTVFGGAALGVLALVLAPRLFPPLETPAAGRALARRDLAIRVAMGVALTLAITAVAAPLGPAWSGLVATFPVMTSVLAVSSHRAEGPAFTVTLLRGTVTGMAGLATFCATLAWGLTAVGTAPAITLAVAGALGSQALLRRG